MFERARVAVVGTALAVALAGCAQPHPLSTGELPTDVASPASTPASVVTSSPATLSQFADGSPFDADCAIAWPTAPVVSKKNIQLTLTCPNVPSAKYVFVVAVYGDPSLAVTPATTTVHVTGTVTDSAMTNTGLEYLVVAAASIDL